jgi:formiminotetrahydrofolate cyclodeaminase
MAAALACMVATMSRGRKAYVQYETQLSPAIARLTTLREELKAAIDEDAESYNVVMKAYKAARESADATNGINAALKQATSVPLGVAERVVETAQIAASLRPITNPNMSSDLVTALSNVDINLTSIKPDTSGDEAFVTKTREQAAALKL